MRRLILSFTALSLALSLPYFAVRSQEEIEVGYAILEVEGGQRPTAAALFSFTNADGILVWEAGVEAVEEISRGRLFVDQSGQTRTAIALVNASDEAVEAGLVLRDADGLEVDRKTEVFAAGEHHSLFVDELFDDPPETGSLTFEAVDGGSLAAVTLRQNTNQHGEAIFAALPAADLDAAPAQDLIVFPQVGAGSGLSTQIILIDTSGAGSSGMIALTASDGEPLEAEVGGQMTSEIPFQIEADGVFRTELSSPVGVRTGYAVVTADEGSALPDGAAIFQFRDGDAVITEAGVATARGTARARMFVDNHRTRTSVALASPANPAAEAAYRLLDRFNQELSATSRPIGEGGHLPIFADELFVEMPAGFSGLMEFVNDVEMVPVSLKLTINARGDPVLTTLPVADDSSATEAQSAQRGQAETRRLIFPQVGLGAGLATRLIVINSDNESQAAATLSFRRTGTGEPLELPLGDRFGSDFDLSLSGVGGIDLRPGNTTPVAEIRLDTFNPEFSEVVVDQGSTLQLRPRVIDSEGNSRDDFTLTFFNLDAQVAKVSPEGFVTGLEKGFSTLRVSAGAVERQGLLTVVEVVRGIDIGETTGIIRDLAGRIYLSSETEHVIWRADSIDSEPVVFAGTPGQAGLGNGDRLQARFNRPAFIALNQGTGDLYVSDSGNNVIRVIRRNGQVETLAGTGTAGSRDGEALQARFRNPQGIALDHRGHLWVSDSGNHTIRRIDLVSGQVGTIAGVAGESGRVDGQGASARFDNPMGIALDAAFTDSLQSPQAVSLVIADSGNGIIRRVFEDGRIVTIGSGSANPGSLRAQIAGALNFRAPSGIAVDTSGAIYLTEAETGLGKVIVSDGRVASLSQSRIGAKGVWATGGQALMSGEFSSSSLRLGSPAIVSITPDSVRFEGGETVTIRGRNFTPDTFLVLGSHVLTDADFHDSQTIVFQAPAGDSGTQTLSTLARGGLTQHPLTFIPVPLDELETGWITTVAGGASTFSGDGAPATAASLDLPFGLAVDGAGNLFIADSLHNRIRKVDPTIGVITTVVGTGKICGNSESCFSGDGGPATAATLDDPSGVVLDRVGNLFIADRENHRVRKVDAATGVITTFAGTGDACAGDGEGCFSGDGGQAREADLRFPTGLALDGAGNLFIADAGNDRIRRVDSATGVITTVAGTGERGFLGDGGPAKAAALTRPSSVAVDEAGNLFIADSLHHRIRKVDSEGVITTVAGTGDRYFFGDGGPATSASLYEPSGVTLDRAGNIFIADAGNDRIRRVDSATGVITTVAGMGEPHFSDGFSGDGGPATAATLHRPSGVAMDGAGNLFIADRENHRVRLVDTVTGFIITIAGTGDPCRRSATRNEDEGDPEGCFSGDGGPATAAALHSPAGIAADGAGNLFIADGGNNRIRRVDSATHVIVTVAGTGERRFLGDAGPATAAALNRPSGVAVDVEGTLFIADTRNNRIRRVDSATGDITTVAGTDRNGFAGDGGPATTAALDRPEGVAIDGAGNLLIADAGNHRIRKVDSATGVITTVAGSGQVGSSQGFFAGDGGPATTAALNRPSGVAVDSSGNIFIADAGNHRIRKVDSATGVITTVAGSGERGYSGDDGLATEAALFTSGIAVDGAGNLFISGNGRIRRVDSATGVITTVAGTGEQGFSGDGGPATAAALPSPSGVAVDGAGNLFIADRFNDRIRAVRSLAAPATDPGIGPGN